MATVVLDTIQDTEADEENGVIRVLRRRAIVSGLSNANTDSRTLEEALDDAGVPQPGDAAPGNPQLILVRRNVRALENSPSKAEVLLEYQATGGFTLWGFSTVFGVDWQYEGGTSLNQTESQLDLFGTQITVSHTYPSTHPQFGGQTITQGGTINVMAPQGVVRATGRFASAYPNLVADYWTGTLNGAPWAGLAANRWLCTNVQWTLHNNSSLPKTYNWVFEFQSTTAAGWQPYVIFIDSESGRAPDSLVAGVGYKQVTWYPTVYYQSLFPV